jgi:hypothetical protein
MRLGATVGDHLIVELAGKGQIGKAVAVNVAHLLAAEAVLEAAESMRHSFHSWP